MLFVSSVCKVFPSRVPVISSYRENILGLGEYLFLIGVCTLSRRLDLVPERQLPFPLAWHRSAAPSVELRRPPIPQCQLAQDGRTTCLDRDHACLTSPARQSETRHISRSQYSDRSHWLDYTPGPATCSHPYLSSDSGEASAATCYLSLPSINRSSH